jgi:hypothetical protein
MMSRALRPEREAAAASPASATAADAARNREYLRVRAALVAGGDVGGDAAAAAIPDAVNECVGGNGLSGDGAVWCPWVGLPPGGPDIPLVLALARAELRAEGAALLAGAVLPSRTLAARLVYLDLSSNTLSDLGEDFRGASALLGALAPLGALAFLSLANNMLQGAGAGALAPALAPSALGRLTHLDLSRCNLNASGARALLRAFALPPPPPAGGAPAAAAEEDAAAEEAALEAAAAALSRDAEEEGAGAGGGGAPHGATPAAHNASLRWLDLSENNLTDNGRRPAAAALLIGALLAHPALRHLSLARNRLGAGGGWCAAALARGARANATLASLDVCGNDLDSQAALARAIGANAASALTHLALKNNRVRSPGASAFAALLRAQAEGAGAAPGRGLAYLDLRENYVGDVGRADIVFALRGLPPPPEALDEPPPPPPRHAPPRRRLEGGGDEDDDGGEGCEEEEEEEEEGSGGAGADEVASLRVDTVDSVSEELAAALASVSSTGSLVVGGGGGGGGGGGNSSSVENDPTGAPSAAGSSRPASGSGGVGGPDSPGSAVPRSASPPTAPSASPPTTGLRAVRALRLARSPAAAADALGGGFPVDGDEPPAPPPPPAPPAAPPPPVRIVALTAAAAGAAANTPRPGTGDRDAEPAYVAVVAAAPFPRRVLL